jgi:predicted dehydrogenase
MMTSLPMPRLVDPAAVPPLRWGVAGAGEIAAAFVRSVRALTRQRVVAVASRTPERASAFATAHGIEAVHPSTEALTADPAVDVVYVATPHTEHRAGALAAIAAGKHVLVEKPFAITRNEATEIATAGRRAGVFVMEAMWPRYNPYFDIVRQSLADGLIGEVHGVVADFGFVAPYEPDGRLWSPRLGGGALLDAGIYPISFASSVLGTPLRVTATGAVTSTGVDARATVVLSYRAGVTALAVTSMVSALPARAMIVGSHGRIELPGPFFAPSEVILTTVAGTAMMATSYSSTLVASGRDALGYQATALAQYVAEGRTESPLHTLDETSDIIGTLEIARASVLAEDA